MLAAMAEVVAQKGYARATVADVLSRARVSRETFYEQFSDKEDCFLAAYDFSVEALLQAIGEAVDEAPADPLDRLEAALAAYLDAMSREGSLARVFLVDVYGAGPTAIARRVAVLDRFVDTIAEILAPYGPERFECEALVAAVSSLVTTRVASGRLDELPALRESLLEVAGRILSVRPR
jgi:AcrR family transcriptional regulator